MYGFRTNGTRPCRNGPNCRFLRNGNCWFYHPNWHNSANHRESESISYESLRRLLLGSSLFQSPSFSTFEPRNSTLQTISPIVSTQPPKTLKIGNRNIQLLKVKCSLQSSKAWFFQNSHHYKYFADCEHKQCSICLESFTDSHILSVLLCNHPFHKDCIQNWLKTSDSCPLCRKDFRLHDQFKKLSGYVPVTKKLTYHDISVSISSGQDWNDVEYSDGEDYGLSVDYDQNSYNQEGQFDYLEDFDDFDGF